MDRLMHAETAQCTITEKSPVAELMSLRESSKIASLRIDSERLITTDITQHLKPLSSLKELSIWARMTRTALRDCLSLPNLHTLACRELTPPGKYINASLAQKLHTLYCNEASEADLKNFSRIPTLRKFGAQNASWSAELLSRFARIQNLQTLDMEASNLSDDMLPAITTSTSITELDIGNTRISRKSLNAITQMSQLQSLDIWNINIDNTDLPILQKLENLSTLALGGYAGQTRLTADLVVPFLCSMPKLQHIWLDNIFLEPDQLEALEASFVSVRYDYDAHF